MNHLHLGVFLRNQMAVFIFLLKQQNNTFLNSIIYVSVPLKLYEGAL